jgi:hypothetical protein
VWVRYGPGLSERGGLLDEPHTLNTGRESRKAGERLNETKPERRRTMENGPGDSRARRKVFILPLIISFLLAVVAIISWVFRGIPARQSAGPVPTAVVYTAQPTFTPVLPAFTPMPTRASPPTPTISPTTVPGFPPIPPLASDGCLLPCAAPWSAAATATAETKATATAEAKESAATATAETWRAMQTQEAADSKARATATAEYREIAATATAEARIAAAINREAQESEKEPKRPGPLGSVASLGSVLSLAVGISPMVADWWQGLRSSRKSKLEVEKLRLQVHKLELQVEQLKKERGDDRPSSRSN